MPPDDRSPIAIGMGWASVILGVSAQMAVPALLGYWIDQRLGTRLVFLLLGVAIGVLLGTLGLLRIAKQQTFDGSDRRDNRDGPQGGGNDVGKPERDLE
jgi:F0F1-type ATP synthase assembly protein I